MENVQRFVKLVILPKSFAQNKTKIKILGCIFPLITGDIKTAYEIGYGKYLNEKDTFYIYGSDFINTILRQPNGFQILLEFKNINNKSLVTFKKDQGEEIIL